MIACMVPGGRPIILDCRIMRLMRCDPNYANMMDLVCRKAFGEPAGRQKVDAVGDGVAEVRS